KEHPGEPGERTARVIAEADAEPESAEHLPLGGAVACTRLLGETGKEDRAAGSDRVPGEDSARADVPRPKARPPIGRKIGGIDGGRTGPRRHARGRIGVACGQAHSPLAEAAVEAGEDATEVAANFGGVAVAVDLARGAHALRPEHEFRRLRRRSR